jgi:hypothetical protein
MKSKSSFRVAVALFLALAIAIPLWLASPVLLAYAQGYGGGGGGGGGGGVDRSPPRFSNISSSNVTKTAADIRWTTHERSTSQVEYWASPSMLTPLDTTMVREHLVHLTDLTPGTTYHYKTMSQDGAGNLAVSDEQTFTTAGTPAIFTTSALTISPAEVDIGQEVTISVVVANIGDASGSYEVTLKIDEAVVATKEVTVAGGASQTVTFTMVEDIAGTYSVSADGSTGTFVVKAAVAPPPPPPPPPPPVSPPPVKQVNWWLIGGIIAVVVAGAVFAWQTFYRRRAS